MGSESVEAGARSVYLDYLTNLPEVGQDSVRAEFRISHFGGGRLEAGGIAGVQRCTHPQPPGRGQLVS